MPSLSRIYEEIDQNISKYVEELREFIGQPSISSQGIGFKEASEMLSRFMQKVGIKAKIIPIEKGFPIVYGRVECPEDSKKTLLVYAHYDVVAPGPVEEWSADPFSAEIINGKIYGRGSADAKGNIFAWLKAVEAFIKVEGRTPINLIFLFEGEEEIGSPHLYEFVVKNMDLFRGADAKVMFDVRQELDGRPLVNLGWCGWLYIEIEATGPREDIHSAYANIVENPAWRLVSALKTLKNKDEILIEGFRDEIEEPQPEDLAFISEIPVNEERLASSLGAKKFRSGAKGTKLFENLLLEPFCNIDGIVGGHIEKGAKAILPSKVVAKLDFRLVPKQDPEVILSKILNHLAKNGFEDLKVRKLISFPPSKTPATKKIVSTILQSVKSTFGMKPIVYPIIHFPAPDYIFTKVLGLPSVGSGCGYMHIAHRPNEYLEINQFLKGIKLASTIMNEFSIEE